MGAFSLRRKSTLVIERCCASSITRGFSYVKQRKGFRYIQPSLRRIVALTEKSPAGREQMRSCPAGLFSQFKFNDLFVEHHIFLFYDHILVVVSEKPVFEPAPLAYLIEELRQGIRILSRTVRSKR